MDALAALGHGPSTVAWLLWHEHTAWIRQGWSTTIRGACIAVEATHDGLLACASGGTGRSIACSRPIPSAGRHTIDVIIENNCKDSGEHLGSYNAIGLIDTAVPGSAEAFERFCGLARLERGFYGVENTGKGGESEQGIRRGAGGLEGVPEAALLAVPKDVPSWRHVFLSSDRITLVIDRDAATLAYLRNGVPVPGLILDISGAGDDTLYLAATLPWSGTSAMLVPPARLSD